MIGSGSCVCTRSQRVGFWCQLAVWSTWVDWPSQHSRPAEEGQATGQAKGEVSCCSGWPRERSDSFSLMVYSHVWERMSWSFITREGREAIIPWTVLMLKHQRLVDHCIADRDNHLYPCVHSSCTSVLLSKDPNPLPRSLCTHNTLIIKYIVLGLLGGIRSNDDPFNLVTKIYVWNKGSGFRNSLIQTLSTPEGRHLLVSGKL